MVSQPHCPTVQLCHYSTVYHCPTVSLSYCINWPSLIVPLPRCLPVPLSHCPTVSLSHCASASISRLSASLNHFLTFSPPTVPLPHCRLHPSSDISLTHYPTASLSPPSLSHCLIVSVSQCFTVNTAIMTCCLNVLLFLCRTASLTQSFRVLMLHNPTGPLPKCSSVPVPHFPSAPSSLFPVVLCSIPTVSHCSIVSFLRRSTVFWRTIIFRTTQK
jgi:hypothetical protein